MDFLKILKSFEEFVYEALTWLVLVPRTLYRILLSPGRMSDYASAQLSSESDNRFSEALSPPLLLILCVLLSHFFDLGIRDPAPVAEGSLEAVLFSSEQNLLLYRTVAFGVWSLVGAFYLLARTGVPVNRETLRVPLYEQCYLVAPFALLVSMGLSLLLLEAHWATVAGTVVSMLATLWFWLAQIVWLRRRAGFPVWRGVVAATVVLLVGSLVNAMVGYVVSKSPGVPAAPPAASEDPGEGADS